MTWNARDAMSLRKEFVLLALQPDVNLRELCRRFAVSPTTGYKWLSRFKELGSAGLQEHSRRPLTSPTRTADDLECEVLAVRNAHPAWGGRKISHLLAGRITPSTVTNVLHRNNLISSEASAVRQGWIRFEHEAPNNLWQMDFKGYIQTGEGLCHPLTVVDDHSRFNLAIQACDCQRTGPVQSHLTEVFRRYGLPVRINTDNGAPWGSPRNPGELTPLGMWLVRLGIQLSWSRPRHPQTNGKNERFHRSLKAEVLNGKSFMTLADAQQAFDEWREIYNQLRPHEALGFKTPIERYRVSSRVFPEQLNEFEYGPDDVLVKAYHNRFRFQKRYFKIAKALSGHWVAVRPSAEGDGRFDVYFCQHRVRKIDLNTPEDGP